MSLDELTKDKKVISILCNQFGDTGKGKFSDFFADCWADVIARGTGGNNAGHTVYINGKEKVFHLLPTGIIYDSEGKKNILGNGMVIDLEVLCQELEELEKENFSFNNLMISNNAHVIMPYHVERDKQDKNLGTTRRGIGPCYTDKIARRGITIEDIHDKLKLSRKIEDISEFYPEQKIEPDIIIEKLTNYSEKIKPFVRDTVKEMHKFIAQGQKILIEGAQGLLLSIEHGTYPYVTSSDCSINGTANGVGLSAKHIDLSLGLIKFPFMTRVGTGPFPTEIGGLKSEEYCSKGTDHDIFYEVSEFLKMEIDLKEIRDAQSYLEKKVDLQYNGISGNPREIKKNMLKKFKEEAHDYIKNNKEKVLELIHSDDLFLQGVGIRLSALEYGATTGRPRRIGWTDAVMAKYAANINGPYFILTKTDCLEGVNNFNICTEYGSVPEEDKKSFRKDEKFLRSLSPLYTNYKGYGSIRDIKNFDDLPQQLKSAISNFEEFTKGNVVIVSIGPEKDQTILKSC